MRKLIESHQLAYSYIKICKVNKAARGEGGVENSKKTIDAFCAFLYTVGAMNESAPKQSENLGGRNTKQSNLFQALRLVGFTSGFIFGPMIFFGGIGWWLSQRFGSLLYIFVSLVIALIISNLLIFKNTGRMMRRIQNK